MREYTEAFDSFNELLCDGLTIGQGDHKLTVYSALEFYSNDEIMAEESFSNHLDNQGLDLLVSLEDCLYSDVRDVLENQIIDSFVNGQKKQAIEQIERLYTPYDFILWLEGNPQELEILRLLAAEYY